MDHTTKRTGLALVDRALPVPAPAPQRTLLQRAWGFATDWLRDRRRLEKEMLETNRRLKTLLEKADSMIAAIQMEGQRLAASEQRAQLRLQQLQSNHDTLRDTLNAHADEIEKLQQDKE
jgi:chromosome segregation ATPase